MAIQKTSKIIKLLGRYKKIILLWLVVSLIFIVSSLIIHFNNEPEDTFKKVVAELLMTSGQALLGAGLIGGGIGGVINFILEEFREEEEEKKERLKDLEEHREKRKESRNKMQFLLQSTYDNVELARVLIKSHQSGKTYGEQIRTRIIPGLIALKDFKRRLGLIEDYQLEQNKDYLEVSLTYMIAYLSALKEEFEVNYLKISNLQNYKEALVNKMTTIFTEISEGDKNELNSIDEKIKFLSRAEKIFRNTEVPSNINIVWEALQELEYLCDFISELRNEDGVISMYQTYFLEHYYHCNKIVKAKDSDVNEKLISKKNFVTNIEELKRIEEKKNSDNPLTNKDSLTLKIMIDELGFNFENSNPR